jgi:hypothetical protein
MIKLGMFLVGIGRILGQQPSWGRMRYLALVIGSGSLAVAAVISVLSVGLADERNEATRSILPVATQERSTAKLLYHHRLTTVVDRDGVAQPVVVVSISPLAPDAPLPPGVAAWPHPGEAVLSSALRRDLGAYPTDMFGRDAGTIAPAGLEVPSERRAYVRPTRSAIVPDAMTPVLAFGGPQGSVGLWGPPTLYAQPRWALLATLGFLLIVPTLLGFAIGAGVGAETRQRRTRHLQAMGASRLHLAVVDVAEAWRGITHGTLIGLGVLLALGIADLNLQYLDTVLLAAQVRRLWLAGVLALVVAHLVAVLVVVIVGSALRSRQRSRRASLAGLPTTTAIVCFVAGLAAIWLPMVLTGSVLRLLSYDVAIVVVAATLSSLLAVALASVGQATASMGRRMGWPGAIVAGRRAHFRSTQSARFTGGVIVAVILFGQVQLYASTLSSIYQQGVSVQQQFGGLALVGGHFEESVGSKDFFTNLPENVGVIWTSSRLELGADEEFDRKKISIELTAGCNVLAVLTIPCEQVRVNLATLTDDFAADLVAGGVLPSGEVSVFPRERPKQASEEVRISLISLDGTGLSSRKLLAMANRAVVGGFEFEGVGDRALTGGTDPLYSQRWVTFFAIIGITPLVAAAAVALGANTLVAAGQSAPIAVFSERRRWLITVTIAGVLLPVAAAGALAAGTYLLLAISMSDKAADISYFTPSRTYVMASVATCVTLGAVLSFWTYRATLQKAARWRPGMS